MLAAYLDESYENGNEGAYAVAYVVARGWDVMKAERLWKEKLAKYESKVFKSKNYVKRPEVLLDFTSAIRDAGLFAGGIVAEQRTVIDVLSGPPFHKQYSQSPYMLLYQQVFVNLGLDLSRAGRSESVSFVCDHNKRFDAVMRRGFEDTRRLNQQSGRHFGSCSFDTDETCLPLQMADLVAGELRKITPNWMAGGEAMTDPLRLLFDANQLWNIHYMTEDAIRYVRELGEERFRRESEESTPA